MIQQTTAKRFWAKVLKSEDGCWLWMGRRNERGYGRYTLPSGKTVYAHRFAFEQYFWPLDECECAMHDCDNPPCVRPSHLTPGSRDDNNKDMAEKGRGRKATGVAQALRVSELYGDVPTAELATFAGVSLMTAKRARRQARLPKGNRWDK